MSYVLPLALIKHSPNLEKLKNKNVILTGVLIVIAFSLFISTNGFSTIGDGQIASAAKETATKLLSSD
ncbi:MAG TPA: hypothetical protein VN455_02235, partial [Methanotrichaceae archaeon]|nr:hypothetical protein [Methanotrichaceae archaeon]